MADIAPNNKPNPTSAPRQISDAEVWLRCYTATLEALNSPSVIAAAAAADQGLDQFRKRFPATPASK